MTEPSERAQQPPPAHRGAGHQDPPVRFDATVHPGALNRDLMGVADLDLDRIPAPGDEVRVVVTPDECRRLLDSGYEVHLHALVPVRPLSAELVADDDSVISWLEERVQGIERAGGA